MFVLVSSYIMSYLWYRKGVNETNLWYLASLLTWICTTRPQWVNDYILYSAKHFRANYTVIRNCHVKLGLGTSFVKVSPSSINSRKTKSNIDALTTWPGHTYITWLILRFCLILHTCIGWSIGKRNTNTTAIIKENYFHSPHQGP